MKAILGFVLWLASLTAGVTAPATNSNATNATARVLIVTGIDYPGHLWRQTAPVLARALGQDQRLSVFTVEDPGFLDSEAIFKYAVIVLHFQNWQQAGPGEKARENLRRFAESGKGLVLLHFACGAWHDEWPEFANLAGRVWAGPQVRQHDPFGPFRVELINNVHPITQGLADFDTQDELYTCLTGDHPIEVLAQAKSKVDNNYYPMAFVSTYGKGRVFHCTLGHDAQALSVPAVQSLFQRACAWAAFLEPAPKANE